MVKISMPLFGHWKKVILKLIGSCYIYKSCQKKRTINVSLVDLVDHFQSLGNTHRPEVQTVRQLDSVLKTENYCLNTPITMDELDLMIDK